MPNIIRIVRGDLVEYLNLDQVRHASYSPPFGERLAEITLDYGNDETLRYTGGNAARIIDRLTVLEMITAGRSPEAFKAG